MLMPAQAFQSGAETILDTALKQKLQHPQLLDKWSKRDEIHQGCQEVLIKTHFLTNISVHYSHKYKKKKKGRDKEIRISVYQDNLSIWFHSFFANIAFLFSYQLLWGKLK